MAGLGLKNFGSEVLTSNDVDGYLMQQTVMVFASSAARTSAFSSASVTPSSGMLSYLTTPGTLEIYNGSAWVSIVAPAQPPGLVLMQPTSVSGTGVSVSNGLISFSGTSQVFVNGVFTSDFRNYRLVFNAVGTQASVANVRWRWRSAGSDYDNSYYNRMWYQHVGSFSTAAVDNNAVAEWLYVANIQNFWTVDIFNPQVNEPTGYTAHHQAWGTSNNLVGETHSWQYVNRQYDGFSLNPTAGTMTGTLSVYGIRGSV